MAGTQLDLFGDIVGVARDAQESRRVLREYAEEARISRARLDELSGLPDGYSTKVLSEYPSKTLGMLSFWNIVGALGLAVAFVKDPRGKHRIRNDTIKKAPLPQGHWRDARYRACAQQIITKTCRVGADTRNNSLNAQERSAHGRMMANARWSAVRRRKKELLALLDRS